MNANKNTKNIANGYCYNCIFTQIFVVFIKNMYYTSYLYSFKKVSQIETKMPQILQIVTVIIGYLYKYL